MKIEIEKEAMERLIESAALGTYVINNANADYESGKPNTYEGALDKVIEEYLKDGLTSIIHIEREIGISKEKALNRTIKDLERYEERELWNQLSSKLADYYYPNEGESAEEAEANLSAEDLYREILLERGVKAIRIADERFEERQANLSKKFENNRNG